MMKKLLCILLAVCMLSALLPFSALADDEPAAEEAVTETTSEPTVTPDPMVTPVQTAAPTATPALTDASAELTGTPDDTLNDSEGSSDVGEPEEEPALAVPPSDDGTETVPADPDHFAVPSETKDPKDDQADPENEEASANRNEDSDEGTPPADTEEEADGETTDNTAAIANASAYVINGVTVQYDEISSSEGDCWNYANHFYNKVWGSSFNSYFDDSNNSLRNLSDSELTMTAEHLKAYISNAAIGSVIRYSSNTYLHSEHDLEGHSQFLVAKDTNGFTVFEGGLINSPDPHCQEINYTWSEAANGSKFPYIKYIKWPGAQAYGTYPSDPFIVVASGNYGTNLTWTLDEEGNLYISGTGDMRDTDQFGTSTIPWYEYRESITSVVIESGVTSVGAYAFYNCTAMKSVKIPASVQSIGEASFCRCSSLTSVTLPDGITAIGREAFIMCSSLTNIVIPSGVTSLDYRVFMGCSALTSVTIPSSVTSLGYEVFGGCSSLTNITIPDSVTYLDWGAFSECSSLSNVTIPESVTYISERAFEKCSSLTSITIPESVTFIGYSVFDRCSALTSITIPSGITTINYGMFSGCVALTSITIPSSVKSISMNAFYKCDALRDVNYGGSAAQKAEIDIKEGNDCLVGARWHYQPTGDEKTVTYKGYSTQFGPNELSISSFAGINNKNMAMLCAMLSDASYSGNGVELADLFRQMFAGTDFDEGRDTKFDYSGGAFCSGMALGKTVINDQETNVLVIVVRGTQELLSGEVIADLSGDTSDLNGYATYTELISFYTDLMKRLSEFVYSHSDIGEKPLKIIVTGHSLGGAGANLLTAMFNQNAYRDSWWAPVADLSDIYGYTYGAIDVMNIYKNPGHGFPLHSGYQNIHNIINDYDVIIVLSNKLRSHGLSGVGKYGHLDFFRKDYGDNHKMLNYLNAVATANVGEMKYKYNRIRISCPVDIDVYQSGKLVGRVVNNSVDESVTTIDLVVIGEDKYIFCPEGAELSFQIIATDDGQMEYSVEYLSSESYEQKTFSNIALTQGERFESIVGGNGIPSDARLYVINSEGEPVREVLEDGTEVEYHPEITPLFTDVSDPTAYYYNAVYWAKEKGITTGKTPTTFQPNAACTRGQIVTFLWRVKGEPEPRSYANPFRDVPTGIYYYKAVLWAYHEGITTGTSATTFGPNQACTRAQCVTFLWRAAGSPDAVVGNQFKDVKSDTWYAKAVYWAANNGITTGTSETAFSPNTSCSRAQIVTFLYRYAG